MECFTCSELGHYFNKCPMKKTAEGNGKEDMSFVKATWDACTFVAYQVHATGMIGKFKQNKVSLDNQVDISVIHSSLLP